MKMRYLKTTELPHCFGIPLAESLVNNEVLKANWEDFMDILGNLEKYNIFELSAARQPMERYANRISQEVIGELDHKRNKEKNIFCKECDIRFQCFSCAVSFIMDDTKWWNGTEEGI